MDYKYSEEQSHIIQAYLSYLQEMSRKISIRSGMENVLYRKPRNNPSYYQSLKDANSRYFRKVKNYLDTQSERQLFLGNGLLFGLFKKKNTKKYIAAPLIYFLTKVEEEENQSLTYNIEWDSISLNYDLITLLMEQDIDEEEELEFQSQGIDVSKLETLEKIENELDNILKDKTEYCIDEGLSKQVFQKLNKEIAEFSLINYSTENYTSDKLENLNSQQGVELTFYEHQFFYIASLPGQLSTYTALRTLILEVS